MLPSDKVLLNTGLSDKSGPQKLQAQIIFILFVKNHLFLFLVGVIYILIQFLGFSR